MRNVNVNRSVLAAALSMVILSANAAGIPVETPPTIALSQLASVLEAESAAASCSTAVCSRQALLVTNDRLDELLRSGQLDQAALSNMPLIVIYGGDDEGASGTAARERIARAVGVASRAAVAVHMPARAQGALHVFALQELPEDPAARTSAVAALLRQVSGWTPPVAPRTVSARSARSAQTRTAGGNNVDIPEMQINVTSVNATPGNLTALEALVMRHVTRSTTALRVLMKSTHNMTSDTFSNDRGTLRVTDRYLTMHAVNPLRLEKTANGSSVPVYVDPQVEDWTPKGTGVTSFQVSATHSTQSGFTLSLKPELISPLTQAGVRSPVEKSGFGAEFASSTTRSRSVSYAVDDYALSSSGTRGGLASWASGYREGTANSAPVRMIEWRHSLAPSVRARLFWPKGADRHVTPAMRSLTTEHASSWTVPATADHLVEITAGSRIEMGTWLYGINIGQPRVYGRERASIYISPDSVWLTREPTVVLRTQDGDGGCLTARDSRPGSQRYDQLAIVSCDAARAVRDKGLQWQLDNYQRYYNRASGKCLTLLPASRFNTAEVALRDCSFARSQAWEWRADRLHNLHDGDQQGRLLAVRNGRVMAVSSDVPVNPHHALLNPWSNYPASPVPGTFIPTLGGSPQQVPPSWIGLPAVAPSWRWDLTVLRNPSGG